MPLRPRDKDPHIPGTSSEPAKCRKDVKEGKCGEPAHHWLEVRTEILGKEVKTKIPFCTEHWKEVVPRVAN